MKKILVVGAGGFIGQSLFDYLTANGIVVFGTLRSNIKKRPNTISLDVTEEIPTNLLNNFNVIIYVAGVSELEHVAEDAQLQEFQKINTIPLINFARESVKAGVEHFIYISSIKVNGDMSQLNHPLTPFQKPNPSTPYAISKHMAEVGLKEISNKSHMQYTIIRPPLVYGPNVKGNFATLIKLVDSNMPLPLGSIKNNRRSLVYIENLLNLIMTCVQNPLAANQTFLVSDDDDLSTYRILDLIRKQLNKKTILIPIPEYILLFFGKISNKIKAINKLTDSLQADISHTKETLNWTPPNTSNQGFKKTIKKTKDNITNDI